MTPRLRFILIILVVLVLVLIPTVVFLNKKSDTLPEVPVVSNDNAALPAVPVDPKGKNVTWAFATYNFFGRIRDLQSTSNGTELVLYTPQNKQIPTFTLTNTTRVFKTDKKQIAPAAISDLKTGMNVAVIATYDLKTYKWTARQIFIPVSTLATPSPAKSAPTVAPTVAR